MESRRPSRCRGKREADNLAQLVRRGATGPQLSLALVTLGIVDDEIVSFALAREKSIDNGRREPSGSDDFVL